jgi:FkbH-like protein
MVLKRTDIACFVASWADKATNLRSIAASLNIALDALVLVDDSPFERNLVRRALPMVTTLELPLDTSLFAQCIADAGCFELRHLTDEDLARTSLYQGNNRREALKLEHTDIRTYLESLNMELRWSEFDRVGVSRITQLVNKTNQFNLRARRYKEREVLDIIEDPDAIGLQFRLVDQFGDNGIIAVLIGRFVGDVVEIDTWLMSCRVLGRQVEVAMLCIFIQEVRRRGAETLRGEYLPTDRNGIVRDLYPRLGFIRSTAAGPAETWTLDLADHVDQSYPMRVVYVGNGPREAR